MARRGGWLRRSLTRRRALAGVVFVAPALALYGWLVLGSFGSAVQYSFYDWNGVGAATFVGFGNYVNVLTSPARLVSLLHSFELMIFFCGGTLALGLAAAVLTRAAVGRRSAALVRTILFMPQVIPIVAAAIGWSWIYSRDGAANQILEAIGLGGVTRAWLGDPSTALAAIGFIGTWALLGLVTMMLTAGITKIDPALYEAARLDGASGFQEFFAVTLPGLRRELVVAATVTIIAALASFDIVYITTQGGPDRATIVPGIDIYNLAFGQQQIGGAAAMGIILMLVVLLVIVPLQRLAAKD